MSENTVTATYTTLVADVRKLDTALLITNGADSYPEDSFADLS